MSTANNKLLDLIHQHITAHGPMPLSSYMSLCLTHPDYGYYRSGDPLGANADFITAPEISQMFGEMIGTWMRLFWQSIGTPDPVTIVELGPGRGTLMADALRVVSRDPAMADAINLVLLETNQTLRSIQSDKLAAFKPRFIHEIEELDQTKGPLIIIANEFFDALPIRQYQWQDGNWHERLIGLEGERLAWGLSSTPIEQQSIPDLPHSPTDGEIFEDAPLAATTLDQIAQLLKKRGGGVLTIDYGYLKTQTGDTFQAVAKHETTDPLADPGNADLTAHVNFDTLSQIASSAGLDIGFLGTQHDLLIGLGIADRAQGLKKANPARTDQIQTDLDRLIGRDQMGELFKAIIMFNAPPPPARTAKNLSAIDNISHGFFGRNGGVSQAPYDSLNISYKSDDDPAAVAHNRALIAKATGITPERLASVKQTHSAICHIITDQYSFADPIEGDGMVTNQPGIALGVLTADCTPVLLADPASGIIGACHAGWEGAVKGIIRATVEQMAALGANPANIIAAIGPNITQPNYEVGPEFATKIIATYPDASRHFAIPDGKAKEHFDLTGFITDRLHELGITQIENIDDCTYAMQENYFSHRHATHNTTTTGRQMSVIVLNATTN